MSQTSNSAPTFGWQHASVIAIGLLVFVLLLLADKTNLKDEAEEPVGGATAEVEATVKGLTTKGKELRAMLSPVTPSEEISSLESRLESTEDSGERTGLLQQIVAGYREAGQYDQAAVFASVIADSDPSPKNLIVAGALFRDANTLPALQADTTVYRRFADEAIGYLEQALRMAPDDEGAKIELGLAYIESRQPGRSMQGISKLVEVVDANPQNTEALFYLGSFSMDTGQFEKAEGRYRQILTAEPGNLQAKYMLGIALEAKGQGASTEFKKLMTEVAEQEQDPELAAAAKSALNRTK